jgi:hypothetical protein
MHRQSVAQADAERVRRRQRYLLFAELTDYVQAVVFPEEEVSVSDLASRLAEFSGTKFHEKTLETALKEAARDTDSELEDLGGRRYRLKASARQRDRRL